MTICSDILPRYTRVLPNNGKGLAFCLTALGSTRLVRFPTLFWTIRISIKTEVVYMRTGNLLAPHEPGLDSNRPAHFAPQARQHP